ncbi:MAG: RtcB family protein [bacterium]
MKREILTEKIPIKLWLDEMEPGAMAQARNLANMPFAFRHIAIMPDSHEGFGMPIGSVLATREVVVPNAVGVDIGCGMCAIRTSLKHISVKELRQILEKAGKQIPVGFKWHSKSQDEKLMPAEYENLPVVRQEYANALKQLGTLGGGNHFIEIQKGSDGYIWIMVHSGSRNLGYLVARFYNGEAVKYNESHGSVVPRKADLAYLPLDIPLSQDYLKEMNYCIEFALANRKLMMDRILEAMVDVLGSYEQGEMINKSHNFAAWENHFNTRVLVHRKGATRAFKGETGMIPGSQGTSSFIIKGKGNPDSFHSCSHGAGRKMGRKQAQRELNLEKEMDFLDKQGILHAVKKRTDLDEAPGSYKDINTVMENQRDLVDIMVKLSPLAVMKG